MAEEQRNFERLFPTVVQMSMIPEHRELNARLLEEIDDVRKTTPNGRPASWSCDVYTTIGSNFLLHQRPGFQRLCEHFVENAERYGRAMDYPMHNHGAAIDMCWLNAYRRGHSQERHTHINYVFGGIYYLKAPPGASKLLIHAPTADVAMVPRVRESTDLNTRYEEIEPLEGLMLIFSGNLRHSVRAGDIDEERISVAMNANLVQQRSS
jgi:uncharacterized protein (TIGR02466 family)